MADDRSYRPDPIQDAPGLTGKPWQTAGLGALIVIVLIFPLAFYQHQFSPNREKQHQGAPSFVGREKCRDCHQAEYDKWKNSHHDKAMDLATEDTVLGDFNNAQFIHQGVITRFFKKGDQFFVNTRGLWSRPP